MNTESNPTTQPRSRRKSCHPLFFPLACLLLLLLGLAVRHLTLQIDQADERDLSLFRLPVPMVSVVR